ncbi:MAG TPA: MFS transporter [Burkholderiales bacterium]|nr:MFS transporter [Burkholderiales bacterium]
MRLAIFSACFVALITFGVRGAFGLFMEPVPAALGFDREVYSLAMAIQNLCWGVGQPFAGALLSRFGGARVLAVGIVLYAAGTGLSAYASTPLELYATAGATAGFGMALASYITALTALATIVAPERRAWAMGIGTAAGSLGQFVVPPMGQAFMDVFGWQATLVLLAGMLASTMVFLPALRKGENAAPSAEMDLPALAVVKMALAHRSYVLLVLGFFTCGFQLAFIQFHLPAYLTGLGHAPSFAAWAIGTIGLFNIVGSYIAAPVGERMGFKFYLAAMYVGRAALILVLLFFPMSQALVLGSAALLGILWLAAAPTTSALVMTMFGVKYMPVLFGVTFFSHQVGSFLGVWMGGLLYSLTGSYDTIWLWCAGLGLFAAALHLPIQERQAPVVALRQAAAG